MAWPCTAATLIRSGRRHQVKASWNASMVSSASCGSLVARSISVLPLPFPAGSSSPTSTERSRPALNDGPSARSSTARTEPGSARPISASCHHSAGVIALRLAGRSSTTVATSPSTASRTPALAAAAWRSAGQKS